MCVLLSSVGGCVVAGGLVGGRVAGGLVGGRVAFVVGGCVVGALVGGWVADFSSVGVQQSKLVKAKCTSNIPSFIKTVASEGFPSFTPFDTWWSGTISCTPKASVPSTCLSS